MTNKPVCDVCNKIIWSIDDVNEIQGIDGYSHFCSNCYKKIDQLIKELKKVFA